jgi:STE24 endopeptidase
VGRPDAVGLVVRGAFNAAAAALVLCWGLVATVRLAMWTVGTYWWVATAALAVGVLAVAVHSAPRLLARLSGARPVSKPALRARLVSLADRAGVSVSGVDELPVVQEDRTTAFVGGGGRFRRVFVASTLVRDWSGDEVAVVVAHECGHHVRHDLWRTWALNSVTLVAAFGLSDAVVRAVGGTVGLTGVDHLAALPLLAIVGGSVWAVASPVRHAQSRRHERLADDFALEVTGDADAFAAVIRRLGERHLVEERPPLLVQWLSFRHPSIRDRLAVAQRYRRGQLVSPRRCDGV